MNEVKSTCVGDMITVVTGTSENAVLHSTDLPFIACIVVAALGCNGGWLGEQALCVRRPTVPA